MCILGPMEKVIQNNVELELASGVTVTLGKMTLLHQAWVEEKYGDKDACLKAITEGNLTRLSEIAYRVMVNKKDFPAITAVEYDDEGEHVEMRTTGPQRLQDAIDTDEDSKALVVAMMKVMRMSNIIVENFEETMEVAKKKQERALKKLIGKKSRTSSTANTDGPPKNSETEPSEKLTTASVK